jgi:hypothetical protein
MEANGSEKAFCVLTFHECRSVTIVQRQFRTYRASVRYVTKTWSAVLLNKKYMYCYLQCIVCDRLLKPRQSFWITCILKWGEQIHKYISGPVPGFGLQLTFSSRGLILCTVAWNMTKRYSFNSYKCHCISHFCYSLFKDRLKSWNDGEYWGQGSSVLWFGPEITLLVSVSIVATFGWYTNGNEGSNCRPQDHLSSLSLVVVLLEAFYTTSYQFKP